MTLAPIIRCQDLSIAYGREVVLRDVNLEIPRGVFLPFVGPNGAGKTTLLRSILGLLKPCSGRVVTPFHESPAGYVSQQKAIDPLYPVSARQIVAMGLYPQLGWWRREGGAEAESVEAALSRLGLSAHAHKHYSELSGGMRQKLLIARALASGAEVLIMDEPTSEIDEASEVEVLRHLHALASEGRTVLLAIHGMQHVKELASRICLVDRGCVRMADAHEREGASL